MIFPLGHIFRVHFDMLRHESSLTTRNNNYVLHESTPLELTIVALGIGSIINLLPYDEMNVDRI